MAGQRSFFLTGANAKITVNGITMAYATDISFQVQVKHVAPQVLGMYEVFEIQPVAIVVTGSFGVIRYAKDATKLAGNPGDAADVGNGIGMWLKDKNIVTRTLGLPFGDSAAEGRVGESFDPAQMHQAMQFDIEIHQKFANGKPDPVKQLAQGINTGVQNVIGGTVGGTLGSLGSNIAQGLINDILGGVDSGPNECAVIRLRKCRVTGMNFQLAKKSAAQQAFNFQAIYYDDDSFVSGTSGKGHAFA